MGRNEPCPCGSGKKYKKCCLAKDQSQRDQLTPRLLTRCSEEATDALLAHAHHTLGDGFLNDAWREFWAEDDELFIPDSPYNMLLIPWALYLWVAGSGGTGAKTVAADFLSSRSAGRLSERTRRFIEACCTEPVSFWQAEAVEPGVGMSMREMATGRECFVYERTGSATLVPWDVMNSFG